MKGFSLFLIAVGAILTFAVTVWVDGVELRTAGIILMIVGAIGLITGLVQGSRSTTRTRQVSGDGRTVVDDTTTRNI